MEEVGEEKIKFPWLPSHGKIRETRGADPGVCLELTIHPGVFSGEEEMNTVSKVQPRCNGSVAKTSVEMPSFPVPTSPKNGSS